MDHQVDDLFSCVGGHAMGYMRAGFKPLRFVEKDEWRRSKLAKHFPGVPIYEDIRDARGTRAFAAVGGPPCQRTSAGAAIHGVRTGETLWPEFRRIIQDSELEWVLVEQPATDEEWRNQVQSDLEADGWAVGWVEITAQELGYPHIRRRHFAIANASMQRLQAARESIAYQIATFPRSTAARMSWVRSIPSVVRMAPGVPRGLAYRRMIEALGDSNPPEMMEVIFKAIKDSK